MKTYEELNSSERKKATISVLDIRTDGGTQYRDLIDQPTVMDYKSAMEDGSEFPPIDTVFDGEIHWIVDGFHRYHALRLLGIKTIAVKYIEGDLDDAKLVALTANTKHGLPRSLATKRKIGLMALQTPALKDKTVYDIARITGLSQPFIAALRDPEIKNKQQESRDRSAEKRLKLEVTNPISSDVLTKPDPNGNYGPDEAEIRASEMALEADQETMYKLLESDDALKTVHEELKKANSLIASLTLRIHGLMNEKNEAIKMVKKLQSENDRYKKMASNWYKSKSEISNDLQIKNFEQTYEQSVS